MIRGDKCAWEEQNTRIQINACGACSTSLDGGNKSSFDSSLRIMAQKLLAQKLFVITAIIIDI